MMYVRRHSARNLTCTMIINIHMYIQVEKAYQYDVCQRSDLYNDNKHTHVHTGGEGIPV